VRIAGKSSSPNVLFPVLSLYFLILSHSHLSLPSLPPFPSHLPPPPPPPNSPTLRPFPPSFPFTPIPLPLNTPYSLFFSPHRSRRRSLSLCFLSTWLMSPEPFPRTAGYKDVPRLELAAYLLVLPCFLPSPPTGHPALGKTFGLSRRLGFPSHKPLSSRKDFF